MCAVLIGTVALSLPQATHGPERLSIIDSLFTSTSATCVTGLVVQDTGTQFTRFGKGVIFTLFQIGGLGIMTFSTLFAGRVGPLTLALAVAFRSSKDNYVFPEETIMVG